MPVERFWLVVAVSVSTWSTSAAHATTIAYDDFSYTPGGALAGNAGGSGWSAPWTNPGTVSGISVVNVASPLTYSSISGGATAVQIDSGTSSALSGARSFAAQTGELWFSVLLRTPGTIGS